MKSIKYYDKQNEIVTRITLNIFQTGVDKINYRILQMLPTNYSDIRKMTGLSKVPVYNRLRETEKFGLIKWYKGTRLIYQTELTEVFKDSIEKIELCISEDIITLVDNFLD